VSPRPDDPSIQDDDLLYRRIHPKQLAWNENVNQWRVSSADWTDPVGEISVYPASLLIQDELPPECVLDGYPTHSLVYVSAEFARGCHLRVVKDPDELDAHPRGKCHAVLLGLKPGRPGKRDQQKPLAQASIFVVLREPIRP
jgi:hypothetical protein